MVFVNLRLKSWIRPALFYRFGDSYSNVNIKWDSPAYKLSLLILLLVVKLHAYSNKPIVKKRSAIKLLSLLDRLPF